MRNPFKVMAAFMLALFMMPSGLQAVDYPYKKAGDFEPLEFYKSVEAFEAKYKTYIQHCLDNSYGGANAGGCYIGYDLWDRELNTYYNILMKALGEKERNLLKDSQRAWIKVLEKTIAFNSALLDKAYPATCTMNLATRSAYVDDFVTPVVKQRALLLKAWCEYVDAHKEIRKK